MAKQKRKIGLVDLTFISVGGILKSGWLFGQPLAVQHTDRAAVAFAVRSSLSSEKLPGLRRGRGFLDPAEPVVGL